MLIENAKMTCFDCEVEFSVVDSTERFYTTSKIQNVDGTPTLNDSLEVCDVDGKQICISPVVSVENEIIKTHYDKFRISGNKNIAGVQIFEHIEDDGRYNPVHAILVV